jgi:uncharacterized protein (DUF1330 family)
MGAEAMPAYVIVQIDSITDPERLRQYRRIGGPSLEACGAEVIAINRPFETLEGAAPQAVVMLRFPTVAAAKAWYDSPLYQSALPHRLAGASCRALIVEGAA